MTKGLVLMLALLAPGLSLAQEAPERVIVKLDDFLALYEKSKVRPDKPEKPPEAYALASARYNGEVQLEDGVATSVVFTATFRVDVLKKEGWVKVPLLPGVVAVRKATISGQEAAVMREGERYTLVTDRRGAFDVVVEFAVSVSNEQGSSAFDFPLVPSGATTLTLSVPGDDAVEVNVANAKDQRSRRVGGKQIIDASIPSGGALGASWQREIPVEEKQLEARVYSEVHTLVGVGEGLLTAESNVNLTMLHQGVDRFKVAVPNDFVLVDVRGAGLRDWSRDEAGMVDVQLNYEAESYVLTLEMERVLAPGAAVTVPLVQPQGVERNKGFVGVLARGTMEVTPGAVKGVTSVDVRTLPADIVGVTDLPVLLGFKYLSADASIPLKVEDHEEVEVLVTLLDAGEATTMTTADGRRLTSATWQVRNNRRQFLRLRLPEGAELWSASVAGRGVQPAKDGEGRILLPLVRSQAAGGALAAFEVNVAYVESGAPREGRSLDIRAELPRADAPTTWAGWTFYVPGGSKVSKSSLEGSLARVDGLSRPPRASEVLQLDRYNGDVQQSANSQAFSGGLGEGTAPVSVGLPLEGDPVYFEKLLTLSDERLWVSFTANKLPK